MAAPGFRERPENDGAEWDAFCARCGSSTDSVQCEACGGEGVDGHDCGEDSCMCRDPEPNVSCSYCQGRGSWLVCLSSEEWCRANPLVDREAVERGRTEWFRVPEIR